MSSTSGRIASGTANYSYFYFQWQLASQSIANNTSTINWQWGLNISSGAYWGTNAVKSVNGYIDGAQVIGANTWSNISGNGDHQLLSGSYTIGHATDGNKNFGITSIGWLYANGNLSNIGYWDLPTIPRHAAITALSVDSGVTAYDEGPCWIEFSNPASTAVDCYIESPVGGSNRMVTNTNATSRHNFTFNSSLINSLQQSSPNSNSFTVRVGIHDSLGGDNYDYRDRTMYIKNDSGQANPTFSDFDYADINSSTIAITGSDQTLIQNKSTLRVTIPTAKKATANKYATMSSYTTTVGASSTNSAWSNSSNVVVDFGSVSDVSGTQSLSVRAIDSRSNSKTVSKSVNILPYLSPSFVQSLEVSYTNNYDTSSGLTVVADGDVIANISPLTMSSVDKNSVNTTSGVKFDVSKGNNTSYSGTYVNVATTQTSGTGAINTVLSTLASAILSKMNGMTSDNTVKWYIKFQITDSLETQYYETSIDIGRSIFRIGIDGNLYHHEVAFTSNTSVTSSSSITPVGSASLNTLTITALAAGTSIGAPSGTLTNGNRLIIRIKDNGTARAISWNSVFRSGELSPPTTTVINKTMYVGFIYNSTDNKWDCILNIGGL